MRRQRKAKNTARRHAKTNVECVVHHKQDREPSSTGKAPTRSSHQQNQNNSEQTECFFKAMQKRSSQEQHTSLEFTAGQHSTCQVEQMDPHWPEHSWMDPGRLGSDTQKIMARNKHMEQRLSRSDGNVDGGSGRRAASMNMQSPTTNATKDEGCVVRT